MSSSSSSSSSSASSSAKPPMFSPSDSSSTVKVSSPLNPATTDTPKAAPRSRAHSTSTLRELPSARGSDLARMASIPVAHSNSLSVDDRNSSSFRLRSRSRSPPAAPVLNLNIPTSPKSPSHTPPGSSPSRWWNDEIEKIPRPWKESPKTNSVPVPAEQTEGWLATKERVAQAVHSVLGTALGVTHEALVMSVDLLDLAPVPGLQAAARTLLDIWDAVQQVDTNRLACLRLTERCADILLSVRAEVKEAGDTVTTELEPAVARLTESFGHVYSFLQKQVHRPFLKRYLKRDEILRQINGCDNELQQALEMFSLRIQIRILKAVQASEARRQQDTELILENIIRPRADSAASSGQNALHLIGVSQQPTGTPPSGGNLGLPATGISSPASASTTTIIPSLPVPFSPSSVSPPVTLTAAAPTSSAAPLVPIVESPSLPSPSHILPLLQNLRKQQNEADAIRDLADLRNIMRTAVSKGSDAEMLDVLGVRRDEMPEAIKTLQRALERAVEKDGATASPTAVVSAEPVSSAVVAQNDTNTNGNGRGRFGKMVRRISLQASPRAALKRTKTEVSRDSRSTESEGGKPRTPPYPKDTLDIEFMETGIDALRRMSEGAEQTLGLPSWTITRYEVDREQKIGIGFFSDVYKGTWRGRTVAIKVLAESTPRNLFVHEVEIWKSLRHPHVLELFGASSTSSDPPWFFVSPYEKNGSLSEFLRKIGPSSGMSSSVSLGEGRSRPTSLPARQQGGSTSQGLGLGLGLGLTPSGRARSGSGSAVVVSSSSGEVSKEMDLLRYMHEISKGMEYLHSNGVLHGDLKAANVLVNDRFHCVISDFGQSELKSEAYRISGTPPPHGTLRWQAPELMRGDCELTMETDVYAFAILCIEILSMGRMPWPSNDDDSVRHFVLRDDSRPVITPSRFATQDLQNLLRMCWHTNPEMRPVFTTVVKELRRQRKNAGANVEDVSSPRMTEWRDLDEYATHPRPSPDMHPIPLPRVSDEGFGGPIPASPPKSDADSFTRTRRELSQSPVFPNSMPNKEEEVFSETTRIQFPEPVPFVPSIPAATTVASSRASSIFTSPPSATSRSEDTSSFGVDPSGYQSPPPANDKIAAIQNERRYRLLLNHDYHPSLTLPLWSPSTVPLGSVGYLSKPEGSFVILFNAFTPQKSSNAEVKQWPSVHGYGKVSMGNQRRDKRNAAQRGLDAIAGLLTFKTMKTDGQISPSTSRRYSYPLRAGHKVAYLCAESTIYRYVDLLDAPKTWFKAHVNDILRVYGAEHHIQKEDLHLVVGTLDTPDYGLFVSHNHPDGQVHFRVYSSSKMNQPWGEFQTDTHFPTETDGPADWREYVGAPVCASKVSYNSPSGAPWHTVLLARLRFKPDVLEPTSL